jgi:hypothetical protein
MMAPVIGKIRGNHQMRRLRHRFVSGRRAARYCALSPCGRGQLRRSMQARSGEGFFRCDPIAATTPHPAAPRASTLSHKGRRVDAVLRVGMPCAREGRPPLRQTKGKPKKRRIRRSEATTTRQRRDRLKGHPQERQHSAAEWRDAGLRARDEKHIMVCVRNGSPKGGDGFSSVHDSPGPKGTPEAYRLTKILAKGWLFGEFGKRNVIQSHKQEFQREARSR